MDVFFPLQISTQARDASVTALICDSVSRNKCKLGHNRLGHPNSKTLMFLLSSGLVNDKVSFKGVSFNCSSCNVGKGKTLPFPMHDFFALKCFDLVHRDVWGIAHMLSHSHYKYCHLY